MSDDGDRSKTNALHKNARARARCNLGFARARRCARSPDRRRLIARRRFGQILIAALRLALLDEAGCLCARKFRVGKSRAARRTLAGFEDAPEPAPAAPVLPWCGHEFSCKCRARSCGSPRTISSVRRNRGGATLMLPFPDGYEPLEAAN
jgi:hypothetical protein